MIASISQVFADVPGDCYSVDIALALARICNATYLPSAQWNDDATVKSLHLRNKIEDADDTHCLIGDVDGTDITILAFRGTGPASTVNWLADFEAKLRPKDTDIQTHEGFAATYESLRPQILKTLPADRTIWITGHSLGGALATLAGVQLQAAGFRVRATYTYGGPRVGNAAFAGSLPSPFYRFVYGSDVVPHLPPQGIYEHGGIKVTASADGTLIKATALGDGGDDNLPLLALLAEPTARLAAGSNNPLQGLLAATVNLLPNPQQQFDSLFNNVLIAAFAQEATQQQEATILETAATQASVLFLPPLRDHFPGKYIKALELAQKNISSTLTTG